MKKRVLVTYASKAGSTEEVARRIGAILLEKHLAVDIIPVERVHDVTPYQAVVAGSAIRAGKLLPNMMSFLEKNREVLQQKPVSVFVVRMSMATVDEESHKTANTYLDPVRALVIPAWEGLFAGMMNLRKLNLLERLLMKVMGTPEGDFRNWEQIRAWAMEIPVGA